MFLRIPAIGVRTRVYPIGKAPDGTLAVPQPGPRLDTAAWFENSPTPGQPGPSIVEGHVDSERGPSVFFRLGDLRPGNRIEVTRLDGTEVVFTVNGVRDFKKNAFPTALVYGARDLATPQLRLITCSDFDRSIGHHVGNTVVFAHLTAFHRSR
jgi:sortase (surface protein transpeptidase)